MFTKSKCVCGAANGKYCSACKAQRYCSIECQTNDWKSHKKTCSTTHLAKEDFIRAMDKGRRHGTPLVPKSTKIADIERYRAKVCGSRNAHSVVRYVINHIRDHWYQLLDYLRDDMHDDYSMLHVYTIPTGDECFESAIPKTKQWSLAIIMTKIGYWYVMFSDHPDGVYKRISKNNMYHGVPDTCSSEDSDCEQYFYNVKTPTEYIYIYIDWWSGV